MSRSTVIPLAEGREHLLDARWRTYTAALHRAQATLDIRDGIAAGEAWRDFLALFLPPHSGGVLCKFRGRE